MIGVLVHTVAWFNCMISPLTCCGRGLHKRNLGICKACTTRLYVCSAYCRVSPTGVRPSLPRLHFLGTSPNDGGLRRSGLKAWILQKKPPIRPRTSHLTTAVLSCAGVGDGPRAIHFVAAAFIENNRGWITSYFLLTVHDFDCHRGIDQHYYYC